MQLSEVGEIAKSEWLKTAELRSDMNLRLDEFIVMPNHFHSIVFIGGNQYNTGNIACRDASARGRDAMHCVSTYKNSFSPQSKNMSSIIRGFKSAVTTYARKHSIVFAWQERFYDIIIHNNDELDRARKYICDNPQNWDEDECNK
jgi:REP element-mobilizing transposase RayT